MMFCLLKEEKKKEGLKKYTKKMSACLTKECTLIYVIDTYLTKPHIIEMLHKGSTQRNEALNGSAVCLSSKTPFYGGTCSFHNRNAMVV